MENKKNEDNMNFSFEDNLINNNNNISMEEQNRRDSLNYKMSFNEHVNEAQNISFQNPKLRQYESKYDLNNQQENNRYNDEISFKVFTINNISFDNKICHKDDDRNISFKAEKSNDQECKNKSELLCTPPKSVYKDDEYVKNLTFGNSKFVSKADVAEANQKELRNENFLLYGNLNNISFEERYERNNVNNANMSFEENSKGKNEFTNDRSKIFKEIVNRTTLSTDIETTFIYNSNSLKKNLIITLIKYNLSTFDKVFRNAKNLQLYSCFEKIKSRMRDSERDLMKKLYFKREVSHSINTIIQNFKSNLLKDKRTYFDKIKESKESKKIKELSELINEKDKKIQELTNIIVNTNEVMKKLNEKIKEFEENQKTFKKCRDNLENLKNSGTVTEIIHFSDTVKKKDFQITFFLQELKELINTNDITLNSFSNPFKYENEDTSYNNLINQERRLVNPLRLSEIDLSPSSRSKAVSIATPHYNISFNSFKRMSNNQMNMFFIKTKNFL